MKRWIGLDVNGWYDYAARDWDAEELAKFDEPVFIDGGYTSLAVKQQSGAWIGGPQAQLSPHGRGAGWGLLGAPDRRRRVSALCDEIRAAAERENALAWYSAVEALSRNAEAIMLTLPDLPSFDEAAQANVLRAMTGRRRPRTHLLWRSVAAFLAGVEAGVITKERDRKRVRIVLHGAHGLEVQTLILRYVSEFPGHIAPERTGYGTLTCAHSGLVSIEQALRDGMEARYPELRETGCERSRLPQTQMFVEHLERSTEILRLKNGNWFEVQAPDLPAGLFNLGDFANDQGAVEQTVLSTPLKGVLREEFIAAVERAVGAVDVMEWQSVARGALIAGRFVARGLPHYLDHLTPISLAVLEGKSARFRSLMPGDATVPANREYVSAPISGLRWGKGKSKIEFYVCKGADEVRHWTVNSDSEAPNDASVELQLRQTPGQSWAKLSVQSKDWPAFRPIELLWDQLTPDGRSPEEILKTLDRPSPVVPTRIVEPADARVWAIGNKGRPPLLSILNDGRKLTLARIQEIADLVGGTRFVPEAGRGLYVISSDGEYPDGLSAENKAQYDVVLERVAIKLRSVADGVDAALPDNKALIVGTWSFARCPVDLQRLIVEQVKLDMEGGTSALLAVSGARGLMVRGAGRVVAEPELIAELIPALVSKNFNNATLNALATLLSRRMHAPQALTPELVSLLVTKLNQSLRLRLATSNFKILFKNALMAVSGLMRYREIDPWALVRDSDLDVDKLAKTLEQIQLKLGDVTLAVTQRDAKLDIVRALIEMLSGNGGDPDILRQIDGLQETDGDGGND